MNNKIIDKIMNYNFIMLFTIILIFLIIGCNRIKIDEYIVPPDSRIIKSLEYDSGFDIKIVSKKNVSDILNYYLNVFKKSGWTNKVKRRNFSVNGEIDFVFLAFFKNGKGIIIDVYPRQKKKTIIKIFSELNV